MGTSERIGEKRQRRVMENRSVERCDWWRETSWDLVRLDVTRYDMIQSASDASEMLY